MEESDVFDKLKKLNKKALRVYNEGLTDRNIKFRDRFEVAKDLMDRQGIQKEKKMSAEEISNTLIGVLQGLGQVFFNGDLIQVDATVKGVIDARERDEEEDNEFDCTSEETVEYEGPVNVKAIDKRKEYGK